MPIVTSWDGVRAYYQNVRWTITGFWFLLDEATDPETGSRQASRTAVPVSAAAIRRVAPLIDLWPAAPEPEPVASAILGADTITVGLVE